MNYEYRKWHIDSSKTKLKSPYSMSAIGICVHNTWNDAPAINEANYMRNNNSVTGYHIAIDDKEAIELIPLNRMAFHAGDGLNGKGNRKYIGIEICYSKSGGEKYKESEENAVHLIAKMLYERNWTISRVKKHEDFSGKNCPHRILDEKRWNSFIKRIQIELDKLNNKHTIPSPTPPKEERKIKMLKDATASSLRNEFISDLEKAYENKVFSDKKWIELAKSGELTLADAILLKHKMDKKSK